MSAAGQEWQLEVLTRTSMGERAYGELKNAIVRGHLPPGERLREADLAARLGVSRSRVREALAKLEREGLVTVSSFRGTWVSELKAQDVREIYGARVLIEPWAARTVASQKDQEVQARLTADISRMREALEDGDVFDLTAADYDFHVSLVSGTGNKRLAGVARQMLDFVWRTTPAVYDKPGVPERLVNEHSRVLEVILSGNGRLAERALRAHLQNGQQLTLEALSPPHHDAAQNASNSKEL